MRCSTDFEKKLNLLIRDIENGLSEDEAAERLEEVCKYAIFKREMRIANEKYSIAIKARNKSIVA
ncbi:MAG: hypothetical protein WC998_00975 [Candidatus Paceibacterota bacterium]|jgi:hypothetical protein